VRATAGEGNRQFCSAPYAFVIGVGCLLVLAGTAFAGTFEMVTLVGAYFLAPPEAALRAGPPAREAPEGLPVTLFIQNNSDEGDRLIGGSTPVAHCVGIRRAFLVNGRRETAPIPEGIVIPAQTTITFEPGKSHLALVGLRTDLVQGETFPLTLRFERAGEVTVVARVRRRVDAAGLEPLPVVTLGDLTIGLASAPPAPAP
jgi:periplasmic copper chaperone A